MAENEPCCGNCRFGKPLTERTVVCKWARMSDAVPSWMRGSGREELYALQSPTDGSDCPCHAPKPTIAEQLSPALRDAERVAGNLAAALKGKDGP